MRANAVPRILLVAALVGTLVRPPLVAAESVFVREEGSFERPCAPVLRLGAEDRPLVGVLAMPCVFAAQDTLETFDVEMEEEGQGSSLYKEIVIFSLIAAAVGYIVYSIIKPDDDEARSDDGSGKPTPFGALLPARVTRSR